MAFSQQTARPARQIPIAVASGTDDVSGTTAAYRQMAELWKLPRALMGGTRAMREAGTEYLPMEAGESDGEYNKRRNRSTLYNAFRKTVSNATAKVFAKPIVLGTDVPANIKGWCEDIDLAGNNLDQFAQAVFFDGMQTGISHVLVDMQKRVEPPKDDTGRPVRPVLLADERRAGLRPYLVHVTAEQLIGWRSENVNGQETLTQIRIMEHLTVPDGVYGEKDVTRIRVIEPTRFQVWEKAADAANYDLVDEGEWTLGRISLATFYANRTGFMEAAPPLQDLADLNVAHWQSSSDQRHILHFARVPILFGSGMDAESAGELREIGSNRAFLVPEPQAKLSYVEHGGAAIEAGRKDIEELEDRMRMMGLEIMVPRSGDVTATAKAIDAAEAHSLVKQTALNLKDALEQAFRFMANWAGQSGDSGGSVQVNTDFGISLRDSQDVTTLLSAVKSGKLSRRTLWSEMKRRGVLSDEFDADDEDELIAEEQEGLEAEEQIDPRTGRPIREPADV